MVSTLRSGVNWVLRSFHYVICLITVLLAITSVGNLQVFVSKQSLSHWDQGSSVLARFLWDAALLLCFMFQHSAMATPWFKGKLEGWLNITVSQRLLYTIVSSSTLLLCIVKWQAIPEAGLWVVDTQGRWYLWLLFFLLHVVAWFLWFLQTLLMDVGEMLGISQIHWYYKGRSQPLTPVKSAHKLLDLYSRLRHPGALLVTAILWIHPLMTLDRLLLTCWFTCYLIYRHSLTETHYTFAEKHFTKTVTHNRHSTSSVVHDYKYAED